MLHFCHSYPQFWPDWAQNFRECLKYHNEWNMFRDSPYFDFWKFLFLKKSIFEFRHFLNGPGYVAWNVFISTFSFYPLKRRKRGKVANILLISLKKVELNRKKDSRGGILPPPLLALLLLNEALSTLKRYNAENDKNSCKYIYVYGWRLIH